MTTTTFSGFLLLLAMMANNGGVDIVSAIPAREYFKAREIDPTIEKLIELAGDAPTSGKKQIAQLLAIRQLAIEVERVKKSSRLAEVRLLLEKIAQGKKANDSTSFAIDYAKRALAVFNGGKHEIPNVEDGWKEGATWIPNSVSLLAGIDSRSSLLHEQPFPDLTAYFGMMPKEAKEQLFDVAEKIGNVRIDRIVFGFGELDRDHCEIFVRVTGKMNSRWFAQSFKAGKVEERTLADGLKIHVLRPLHADGEGPAMALVGDTDFLLAGKESMKVRNLGPVRFAQEANTATLEKMLSLVVKPGPNATDILKTVPAKIPVNANAAVLGKLPSWMNNESRFPKPQRFVLHARRTVGGIDVQFQARMDSEDKAKKLVQSISAERDAVVEHIPLLKSMQVRSEADAVRIQLLVPFDALTSIPAFFASK